MADLKRKWMNQFDQQSSFVRVSTFWIAIINGKWIHCSRNIAPNKREVYRMKVSSNIVVWFHHNLLLMILLYNIKVSQM